MAKYSIRVKTLGVILEESRKRIVPAATEVRRYQEICHIYSIYKYIYYIYIITQVRNENTKF